MEDKWISTRDAMLILKARGYGHYTLATMRNWARKIPLGKLISGRWAIDRGKLLSLIGEGDAKKETGSPRPNRKKKLPAKFTEKKVWEVD